MNYSNSNPIIIDLIKLGVFPNYSKNISKL